MMLSKTSQKEFNRISESNDFFLIFRNFKKYPKYKTINSIF